MKRKFKLIVLITLFSNLLFSQNKDYEIVQNKKIILNTKKKFNYSFQDKEGFYNLNAETNGANNDPNNFSISYYNNNYIQTNFMKIEPNKWQTLKKCIDLKKINGKIYLFFYITTINNKTVELFIQEVKPYATGFIGEPRLIHQFTYTKRNNFSFNYYYPPQIINDSICILNARIRSDTEDFNSTETFIFFDKNFNIVWEKNIKDSYDHNELCDAERKENEFSSYNYSTSNSFFDINSTGIISKLYVLKDNLVVNTCKLAESYKFELVCYYNKGTELIKYPISLPNKYIVDMQKFYTENNKIILFGYYSNTNSTIIDGCFYQELDLLTKKIEISTLNQFDANFLKELPFENEHSKYFYGKNGVRCGYVYNIKDIFFSSQNTIIITEQYSEDDVVSSIPNRSFDNYNSILVTSFKRNGEIQWVKRIPKYQYDQVYEYNSYSAIQHKNNLYIIYNDNPENDNKKIDEKLSLFDSWNKKSVVIIKIDSDGNMSKNILINSDLNKNYKYFNAREVKKISENKYLYQTVKWQGEVNILEIIFK